ncbi:MAG TPA: TldD/PmbA family protein [Thermomicrobiaceae bacterium]|nr:TldD/PmbA family protein [Thermomicrobiaceae bacterium]
MTGMKDMTNPIEIAAHAVELARGPGATDAEAWLQSRKTSRVSVRVGQVEELSDAESSVLVLRAFFGGQVATVYTADLSPEGMRQLVMQSVDLARFIEPDPFAGLPDGQLADPSLDPALDLYDDDLFAASPATLADLAKRAEDAARGYDPRITNSEGVIVERGLTETTLVNSRGFSGSYHATGCSLSAAVIADDADNKKRSGRWSTSARFLSCLDDPEQTGRKAAERAIRQLGACPIATQTAPVVWDPAAGEYLLDFFANAASGRLLNEGTTYLSGRESQSIAAPNVSIVDDPLLPGGLGSRPFDDEGCLPRPVRIISGGVFNGFLFDSYQARRAGRASNGHAGRGYQGNDFALGIQPSNLSLVPGDRAPDAIVSEVEQGLYFTQLGGVSLNQTTGDLSLGAVGRWIERGQLTYPVSEITVAGRIPDLLASIDAIGNDPVRLGSITVPTFRVSRMTISGR